MSRLPVSLAPDDERLYLMALRSWSTLWAGVIVVIIALLDLYVRGNDHLLVHGVADGTGHVLTGLLFAMVLIRCGIPLSLPWTILGSFVIDLDHISWLTAWIAQPDHTSRSMAHSMTTVAVIAAIGLIDSKRRRIYVSVAVGIALHIVRDLATGNVRLWWPMSDDVYGISYYGYAFGLGMVGAFLIARPSRHPDRQVYPDTEPVRSPFTPIHLITGSKKDT